jgi:hypothetical protein
LTAIFGFDSVTVVQALGRLGESRWKNRSR